MQIPRSKFPKIILNTILLVFFISTSFISAQTSVPQRSEIEDKYQWHLQDIYPDTIIWKRDFQNVMTKTEELGKFRGLLGKSAGNLHQCLALRDTLNIAFWKLYVYASMKLDEDMRKPDFQQLQDRIQAASAKFSESLSFINPEIIAIPQDTLEYFLNASPGLSNYKFYLENINRTKSHILSPPEESILSLVENVTAGPSDFFNMIDNVDIDYPFIIGADGDTIKLTKERYYELTESPDRKLRADAARKFNEAYETYINSLGASLASSVNCDWFYAQARNYGSCLERSLDTDNVPVAVYENLISTVNSNLQPLRKWLQVRKRILGLEEIHPYDLSVPLVPAAKERIPYDEGKGMFISAIRPLGKDYVAAAIKGLESHWIDVYETEGKQSGGYNWGSFGTHPYILMNYNDNMDGLFTIAHEMGHAMNSYYSDKAQPYIYSNMSTMVAEVASTANEILLINYLMNSAVSKEKKLYYLNYYIEQILNTLYGQTMYAEYEKMIHEVVENGGALSAESLRKIYRDLTQKYYGGELVIDDWADLKWSRVSHFYNSYYVYSYAVSYAAAEAIAQKILAADKIALTNYRELLASGGNDYPINQLQKAGVDLITPAPIEMTIAHLSELIEQFESLKAE